MITISIIFPKGVTLILVDHVVFLLVLICHYDPINIPLVHSQPKNKNKMMNSHCRDVAVVSRCLLKERWSYQGNGHFVKKNKENPRYMYSCIGLRQLTTISQKEVTNAFQQKNSVPLIKNYFRHYHAIKA